MKQVIYEWDPLKTAGNLDKHGISFEDAVTVFIDPLAMTFPDPDHSVKENREISIGLTRKQRLVFVSHCERGGRMRMISARTATRAREGNMRKVLAKTADSDLRKQYDLSQLPDGRRGKYYQRASTDTNLVLIEPDLASLFPDSESVNRALRLLAEAARAATGSKRRPSQAKTDSVAR